MKESNIISQDEKANAETTNSGRIAPPSMIFVPATAGLMLAREVVFDIINGEKL
jgi:tRNA A37 threonylcarbamoyladenosine dehydratase